MQLNELGKIVQAEWERTFVMRPMVELGAYVIMPNHFHVIVHIVDELPAVEKMDIEGSGTVHRAATNADMNAERFGKPVSGSIPTIVRSFKSAVTKRINEIRHSPNGHVWQRNYYEHIIRSEKEYLNIEGYIQNNPANWIKDTFWPENK